ncbi:PQQ-binding-like beta-propeller repeat protein [bacterium]|nr:PQQ-binding-like beta-propeller repeat protein [bacterium]
MKIKNNLILLLLVLGAVISTSFVHSSDWPMWGKDAGRTFSSDANINENLELRWTRELGEPSRAWPFQLEEFEKLAFDVSYEPIASDGKVFISSMRADKVTAYSAKNGEELWRYYVDGPVRLAPVYENGKLYFISDDGYLYCLNSNTGKLLWKFKGFFAEKRNVLGNNRLVSIWAARGGPVLSDGVVYFASGVFPFEGVFVHAVDAKTGKSIWTNSTSGSLWSHHQHAGAWAFGGISPQGYLAVSGDKLIVSGGRTVPAVYDRYTGELLYYQQSNIVVGLGVGGYKVSTWKGWFANHDSLYSIDDGAKFGVVPISVVSDDSIIGVNRGCLIAHKSELKRKDIEVKDRLGVGAIRVQYELKKLWEDTNISGIKQLFLKSGSFVAVSLSDNEAGLVKLASNGSPESIVWRYKIEGVIWSMIASEGRLFIVNEDGKIYCFAKKTGEDVSHHKEEKESYKQNEEHIKISSQIISQTGVTDGYALFWGLGDGEVIKTLLDKTSLHIVAVEQNKKQVDLLRRRFDDLGYYGKRVSVINADPTQFSFPAYMADLIVLLDRKYNQKDIQKAFNSLRPYGGKIYVNNVVNNLSEMYKKADLENGKLYLQKDFAIISREGPLKGAGKWTHQYADASNRVYSDDELVKAPLGVLWYGSTSNADTLPRHHNGPVPQVVGGRLFILGIDILCARCVYTGRQLWVKEIPGVGHPFTTLELEKRFNRGMQVNMTDAPGANFLGSPYVSLEDGIYIKDKDKILLLEPSTGKTKKEFHLPYIKELKRPEWGYIMVWKDILIATIDPQYFDEELPGKAENWNATSSTLLVAMDRHSGKILWVRQAKKIGFRHNAIVAGNGKLYAIDGLSEGLLERLQRRGLTADTESSIMALDIMTGKQIWEREGDVFGTWLSYYEDKDILIQGGRPGQLKCLIDEPGNRIIAHRGTTGEIIWDKRFNYGGPISLHNSMIIPGRPGQNVLEPDTGALFQIKNSITGDGYNWTYFRAYGCGTMHSSKYLIAFRSGTAGFNDLLNFGGTGNFGGFKAGCTNNLVPADGVLNAPEYTRSCVCAYQLQTSLALVHHPELETWTYDRRLTIGKKRVESLGINFGAPGSRKEKNVFWLEYPKIHPDGPDLKIDLKGDKIEWFRNHSSWIKNTQEGHAWVASYGIKGIENININLSSGGKEKTFYDLIFYLTEPEEIGVGKRVFDIYAQGKKVVEGFDIVKKAGGERQLVTVKVEKVEVEDGLGISFAPKDGSLPPVISGIEIVLSSN